MRKEPTKANRANSISTSRSSTGSIRHPRIPLANYTKPWGKLRCWQYRSTSLSGIHRRLLDPPTINWIRSHNIDGYTLDINFRSSVKEVGSTINEEFVNDENSAEIHDRGRMCDFAILVFQFLHLVASWIHFNDWYQPRLYTRKLRQYWCYT